MKTALFMLFGAISSAQYYRFDPQSVMTTTGSTPPGAYAPLYAVPGSTITLCTDSACTSLATTYTSGSGSACPTSAQVTLSGSAVCRATSGPLGDFGFWLTQGLYYYKVTLPTGVVYGTFPISVAAGGGGTLPSPTIANAFQYPQVNPAGSAYRLASLPFFQVTDYNFTAQQPGGTLSIGGNVITLNPAPQGIAVGDYLYISGGTGSAEAVLVSGWNSSTGQLIITCANTHSGAWTIKSATSGVQEAEVAAAAAGGGTVLFAPGTYTMHSTVFITGNGIHFESQSGRETTTIYRTEDYGHTFQAGTALVGGISDIQFKDLTMTYDMGPVFNGSGQITSITRKPTVYPNSAHIYGYGLIYFRLIRCRLNDMPYNLVSMGGAYSSVEDSQFQGLWDYTNSAMQVTKASLYLSGDSTPHGSTQGFYTSQSDFFGFNSPPRNVTINGHVVSLSENIGPDCMIKADYVEVMQYSGGLNGGGGAGVCMNPVTFGISGVTITGVHFDGNRRAAGVLIDSSNSLTGNVINMEFTGNDCQGSGNSASCFVINQSSGIRPATAVSMSGNMMSTFYASAISLLDGVGISIGSGNTIRNFNTVNAYDSTQHTGDSAINIGGSADQIGVGGGNVYCGGTYDMYAMTVDNSAHVTVLPGRNNGCTQAGASPDLGFSSMLQGPSNTASINYIATENGSANAIAGTLPYISGGPTDGLCVQVNLAHALQAGANTFALNGTSAVPIKSHLNTANNIATPYSGGASFWIGCYKSSSNIWMDMSQ